MTATEAQPKTSTENNGTNVETPQIDAGDNNRDNHSPPTTANGDADANPTVKKVYDLFYLLDRALSLPAH